ncbi:hypothetical protein Hanom_Chr04g00349931 [Helianthus anomalus]
MLLLLLYMPYNLMLLEQLPIFYVRNFFFNGKFLLIMSSVGLEPKTSPSQGV